MDTTADPKDELPHPVGDHPAWSESYYFNAIDPSSAVGFFTRMGFRSGDGWADGLHGVYLGGDRVAFCYARRDLPAGDQDLQVGGLRLTMEEPFRRWTVAYDGPAQDVRHGPVMVIPRKERPEGWATAAHLTMEVAFEAVSEPHYAAGGAQGHFEQVCRATGRITLGDESWDLDGHGVRDKSWGPRTWSGGGGSGAGGGGSSAPAPRSRPFTTWFSGNAGTDLAFGGSAFDAGDGQIRGAGWFRRGGETVDLLDLRVESEFGDDPLLHTVCRVTGRTPDGEAVEVTGDVLTICPTKIPMPGGATLVNEGLARFSIQGREGYGIAEYWHAVTR